jgi:hypothetical protein
MAKRDYILNNFWWKVTSLLLAIVVWFVVYANSSHGSADFRRNILFSKHSLALMRDSNDKRPLRVTPTEVDIMVSVPVADAGNITDSDIQTFIDLTEVSGLRNKVRIRVYVPQGVRLESITPEEATVEILE